MADYYELFFGLGIVIAIVIGLAIFIAAPIIIITNHIEVKDVPAQREALETTYLDAKETYQFQPLSQLLNSIARFNVSLKRMQYWNTVLFVSWFIPDRWDDIKTINIKEKK